MSTAAAPCQARTKSVGKKRAIPRNGLAGLVDARSLQSMFCADAADRHLHAVIRVLVNATGEVTDAVSAPTRRMLSTIPMTNLYRIAVHEASHVTAALCYSVPIISVTIDPNRPHMHRDNYRAPEGIATEAVVVVCVAGPIGEQIHCGAIDDGSDQIDLEQARKYLRRAGCNELLIGARLQQARTAARSLLTSPWGSQRLRLISDALLRRGSLTGEEIAALTA